MFSILTTDVAAIFHSWFSILFDISKDTHRPDWLTTIAPPFWLQESAFAFHDQEYCVLHRILLLSCGCLCPACLEYLGWELMSKVGKGFMLATGGSWCWSKDTGHYFCQVQQFIRYFYWEITWSEADGNRSIFHDLANVGTSSWCYFCLHLYLCLCIVAFLKLTLNS